MLEITCEQMLVRDIASVKFDQDSLEKYSDKIKRLGGSLREPWIELRRHAEWQSALHLEAVADDRAWASWHNKMKRHYQAQCGDRGG